MLLTLPIILGVFTLATSSSALNIYSRIKKIIDPGNTQVWPLAGVRYFLNYAGVTQSVLEKTIEILKQTGGWIDCSNVTRQVIFSNIADGVAEVAKCDPAGVRRWCNLVYIACTQDATVKNFFENPNATYTALDRVADAISDTVTSAQDTVIEYGDYIVMPSTTAKSGINPIIKYALIGAAGYFVIRKILK